METITIVLGIVMLVFGILQIILFFKVWGMTNDVSAIREKINPHKVETPVVQKQEPVVVLDTVWRCVRCDTINHYKGNGEAICENCGYDLHK